MRRLIIRPGAIGDCMLSLPALEYLRSDYTEVWVPSAIVPLIRFADRVRSIISTGLDCLELPDSLIETLRTFDSIVSWYASNRDEFRARVRELGLPFTFHRALPPENSGLHATDFFLTQVGCEAKRIPQIHFPLVKRENFAIIHPFSGSPRKNWPLERYRDLATRLPLEVCWCAGPEDPPLPGATRIEDLYELGCWLSSAGLYIGNDSGITHLAASAATPSIAIFGPTDPAIWAPKGSRVRAVQGALQQIEVNTVLEAIARLNAQGKIGQS